MATLATYTFSHMVNEIKQESRNSGNTELDSWIKVIINEELARFTALKKYPQMFKKDQQLTLIAATSAVSLPSDLQHLDRKNIRFLTSGDERGRILKAYDKYRQITSGPTCQFTRQNGVLLLTPYASIVTGDYLLLDYWKLPTILSADADIFPITELITVVKSACIARAVTFDDPKQYTRFKTQEKEAYIASQSIQN